MCDCDDDVYETEYLPPYEMGVGPASLFNRLYGALLKPDRDGCSEKGLVVVHVCRKWPGGGTAVINGNKVFSFEGTRSTNVGFKEATDGEKPEMPSGANLTVEWAECLGDLAISTKETMTSPEDGIERVPGLSGFQEGKLPTWLKEHFQGDVDAEDLEYDELLDLFCNGCVCRCGVAEIDGEEVAVFETLGFCSDDLADVSEFAFWAANGFVTAEENGRFPSRPIHQLTK